MQTGCVTGRRHIAVSVPATVAGPSTKGPVYIHSVTDNRVFQNRPSDPSTPSIDGDVNSLSSAQKNQMIGRQRGGFGGAYGDIALADNDTITGLARRLVAEGLRQNGYKISNDPAAPITIDAKVDEFWTWMTPGFVALTFEVKIATDLTFTEGNNSITETISGYGRSHGQIAKDGNWEQTFRPAFKSYLDDFKNALNKVDVYFNEPGRSQDMTDELYTKLKQLDELRKEGILTEQEFQQQKQKLLHKD